MVGMEGRGRREGVKGCLDGGGGSGLIALPVHCHPPGPSLATPLPLSGTHFPAARPGHSPACRHHAWPSTPTNRVGKGFQRRKEGRGEVW